MIRSAPGSGSMIPSRQVMSNDVSVLPDTKYSTCACRADAQAMI